MSATIAAGALAQLRQMAESGALDRFCEQQGLVLLVVFGSAVRADEATEAADLDVAVRFAPSANPDVLNVTAALAALLGTERIDVMDLSRASVVARRRALVGTEPLYENRAGLFAEQQIAAMLEFMDTAWLRRLDLELMAERPPCPAASWRPSG